MPDFTIPTRPWLALLLGALNTALAFIVGAKTSDSGLSPIALFYLACTLAVMGWVLLHIVPSRPDAPVGNLGSPRGSEGPGASLSSATPVATVATGTPAAVAPGVAMAGEALPPHG